MSIIKFQDFQSCGNWINNQNKKDETSDRIKIISPYFDKQIATIPNSDDEDVNQAVEAASSAFLNWSRTNIRDRAQIMFRFKSIIETYPLEYKNLLPVEKKLNNGIIEKKGNPDEVISTYLNSLNL